MLDKSSSQPLYEQIKDYILERIASGEYSPHSRLPSERKLSNHLAVSRLTVSKAIKQLVQEGLLYTQVGKGTYVATDPIQQQIDTLSSFTEEMKIRGQTTSSRVLSARVKSASAEVAEILNIPLGIDVVELERVRMVAQQPMAIEQSTIRADL
ncbi:MAG: GntR family transcriptional regulator, partial [Chloroflexota bacterium]